MRRVSGETLPEYVQEKIFRPLGMMDTMFLPASVARSAHRADRNSEGRRLRFEAWSTIRPPVIWVEWRGMQACFPPPRIFRNSPR